MRAIRTIAVRCLLASFSGLMVLACIGAAAEEAKQPVAIQFSFDRPLEASAAPFVVALDHGLFSAEGLAVSTNIASGSPDAIARVASDASDLALFNNSPYAFVARKSRGIHALSDLEGKTVGVADSDFSIRMWPALARQNGIKLASVKLNRISAAVREPILSAGQVDAVAAFSYLAAVNLRDR